VFTDTVATIARLLDSLRLQTVRDALELVVVCRSERELGLAAADVAGIRAVQVIEVERELLLHEATAIGVRATSAPVVLVGETHAFPDPEALELVVGCFDDETIGGVAPGLRNANPGPASWASLMVTYGAALGSEPSDRESISTHNGAVRRELLLALGDELPFRLTLGGGLGEAVRRQGYRLRYEPGIVFAHLNVARLRSCLNDRYHAARIYASGRSHDWSVGRRAVYVAGAPLLPPVLAWRISHSRGWREYRRELDWRVWPTLLLSVVGIAAGETAACLRGVGRSFQLVEEYEVHRERHV
jgi:hypothetical protein